MPFWFSLEGKRGIGSGLDSGDLLSQAAANPHWEI
jgi:hypothetical protein